MTSIGVSGILLIGTVVLVMIGCLSLVLYLVLKK
ncbi:hypothetical protein ALCH109712_08895 [Alkalicoccus chagannorensis]